MPLKQGVGRGSSTDHIGRQKGSDYAHRHHYGIEERGGTFDIPVFFNVNEFVRIADRQFKGLNQTFLAIAPFDERKKGPVKEIAHAVQLDACGVNGGHGGSNRRSFRDRHTSVKSKQDVEFALFRFGLQLFNEFDGIAGLCGQMKTLGHGLRIPADSKLDTLALLQLLLGGKTVVDEPLSVYAIIDNRRLRERIGRKDGTGHVRLGVTSPTVATTAPGMPPVTKPT